MAVKDVKSTAAHIKQGDIAGVYYFYGADIVQTEALTKQLIRKATGGNETMALTKYDGKNLDLDELASSAELFPMMSEYNCIWIHDLNAESCREDQLKKLMEIISDTGDQTVIVFSVTGFDVKDGKTLLISKYALDRVSYNIISDDVTWGTCTLRKWLNNGFLGAAFSADEKAMIPTVTVSADKNPEYSTNPGNATQDQVFLLSITETNKYFNSDSARQCKPTDYAVANGAWKSDSGNCWWWLRSPGYFQYFAANVYCDGDALEYGYLVTYDYGDYGAAVRPAMWITIK